MDPALGAQPPTSGEGTSAEKTDTTKDWEALLGAMRDYDKTLIDGWVASMNNLLIFAGLFSAVVTAFIIESYSQLQPDPADTTNMLLAQISLQLSSFSVNPAFINSTSPSAAVAAFQPSTLAVRVNVLWFLSLSLSLIAALFAILVQQWLSEYPVRRVTSVREGVRLRQLRFSAMYNWGVPDIVALLPVLIQVALLLFLVGLVLLLWPMNSVVAHAIVGFLAVPLGFFALTAVLPFISNLCPYKSTITTILRTCWLLPPVVVLHIVWIIFTIGRCLAVIPLLVCLFSTERTASTVSYIKKVIFTVHYQFNRAINTSRTRLTSRADWTNYDSQEVPPRQPELDFSALVWSPRVLSHSTIPQFDLCLSDLTARNRALCVLTWSAAAFTLSIDDTQTFSRFLDGTLYEHRASGGLDWQNVERFRVLLLDSLPGWRFAKNDMVVTTAMLTVLRHLVKLHPAPNTAYMEHYQKILLSEFKQYPRVIRPMIRASSFKRARMPIWHFSDQVRVVTRSLLECWLRDGVPVHLINFGELDTSMSELIEFSTITIKRNDTYYRFEEHDCVLSLLSASFLLHQHHPSSTSEALQARLSQLSYLVRAQSRAAFAETAVLSLDAKKTDGLWPTLIISLRALVEHARPNRLPGIMVVPLVDRLLFVFKHAQSSYLQGLVEPLQELRDVCTAEADTGLATSVLVQDTLPGPSPVELLANLEGNGEGHVDTTPDTTESEKPADILEGSSRHAPLTAADVPILEYEDDGRTGPSSSSPRPRPLDRHTSDVSNNAPRSHPGASQTAALRNVSNS